MLSTIDAALLIGGYLLINAVVLIVYFLDKRAAARKRWRISERTLLLAALIAPFGAVGGMRTFRHKTRKTKFLLAYVFLALHLAIIGYLALLSMTGGALSLPG